MIVIRSRPSQPLAKAAPTADDLHMLSRGATWLSVLGGLTAVLGLVLILLPGPGLSVIVLGVYGV
jgi:hypothetical protein